MVMHFIYSHANRDLLSVSWDRLSLSDTKGKISSHSISVSVDYPTHIHELYKNNYYYVQQA